MHLIAFLTDPIRLLRGFGARHMNGKFTLNFLGNTESPWNALEGRIRCFIEGNSPVPNYTLFCAYYKALRILVTKTWSLETDSDDIIQDKHAEALEKLGEARIRGNVKLFRRSHKALIAVTSVILEKELKLGAYQYLQEGSFDHRLKIDYAEHSINTTPELREQRVREIIYLMLELETLLPAEGTSTSFMGHREVDKALRKLRKASVNANSEP